VHADYLLSRIQSTTARYRRRPALVRRSGRYPCLFEHKCLGTKGWRAIERDGLLNAYPQYHAQCQIYMAYLDLTETFFTAVNADTMERLSLLVPLDAERAQAWSDRAVTVIEATRAGELLPRGFDDPTDWRCRVCSHHKRCWEAM
jgi:hypothetical protein